MNPVDLLIAHLAQMHAAKKIDKLTVKAVSLNEALENLHCRANSSRAAEEGVRALFKEHLPAAVVGIADVRGFGSLARIGRRIMREEQIA